MEESASWRTARNPNVAGKKTGAGGKEKGKIRIRATRSPSLIHDLGDVEGKRCRGRPEGIKSGVLACPGGLAAIWPGGHEASASDQACSGQTDSSEGQDPGRGSGLFAKDKNVNAYATDANATRQTVARTVSPRAPPWGSFPCSRNFSQGQ